ncbi:uncharacterized protein LOC129311560 isoform X2 [Prosopis cineraria]|uniref:uncharacterized protein LOC129311560 isoform X2 n=1 Tax=Prosopis cineraria TaxID=364024 RepID=UPI00240F74C6|nr:uncharacterized protein LOC129311560 isoform X2 [Prosopis cineraria]
MASKLLLLGRLLRSAKPSLAFPSLNSCSLVYGSRLLPLKASQILGFLENIHLPPPPSSSSSRSFCSRSLNVEGPAAIDYRSILQEDEFHRLADNAIHDLQEKLEGYGDSVEVDGFDIDYGWSI